MDVATKIPLLATSTSFSRMRHESVKLHRIHQVIVPTIHGRVILCIHGFEIVLFLHRFICKLNEEKAARIGAVAMVGNWK